jgi:hypothetical protein
MHQNYKVNSIGLKLRPSAFHLKLRSFDQRSSEAVRMTPPVEAGRRGRNLGSVHRLAAPMPLWQRGNHER